MGSIGSAVGNALFSQSAAMGALCTLFAAVGPAAGGQFIGPSGIGEFWGYPTQVKGSKASHSEAFMATLWEFSETATRARFSQLENTPTTTEGQDAEPAV